MISHSHKYIFVHVPKTAGRSIEKILRKSSNDIEFDDGWNPELNAWQQHLSVQTILENRPICKKYFKFSVVRNPWDRMVSCFFYFKRHGIMGSFRDFLNEEGLYRNNFPTFNGQPGCMEHRNLMISFLSHDREFDIDFIARFENLQHDFNTICDRIKIPCKTLPQINKTKHHHYTQYYNDETRKIVADKYAKDIEYFGYVFEE
jgi:chondroitin 4-sulfotransferase 11